MLSVAALLLLVVACGLGVRPTGRAVDGRFQWMCPSGLGAFAASDVSTSDPEHALAQECTRRSVLAATERW
jgi:hypothetical protein